MISESLESSVPSFAFVDPVVLFSCQLNVVFSALQKCKNQLRKCDIYFFYSFSFSITISQILSPFQEMKGGGHSFRYNSLEPTPSALTGQRSD